MSDPDCGQNSLRGNRLEEWERLAATVPAFLQRDLLHFVNRFNTPNEFGSISSFLESERALTLAYDILKVRAKLGAFTGFSDLARIETLATETVLSLFTNLPSKGLASDEADQPGTAPLQAQDPVSFRFADSFCLSLAVLPVKVLALASTFSELHARKQAMILLDLKRTKGNLQRRIEARDARRKKVEEELGGGDDLDDALREDPELTRLNDSIQRYQIKRNRLMIEQSVLKGTDLSRMLRIIERNVAEWIADLEAKIARLKGSEDLDDKLRLIELQLELIDLRLDLDHAQKEIGPLISPQSPTPF